MFRGVEFIAVRKALTNRVNGPLAFLSFSVMASLALCVPLQADDMECEDIEATIRSSLTSATTTAGTIDGDLEGTTAFTILLADPSPTLATLAYTGTLVITTEDGVLTTSSTGIFTPAPNAPGTQFDAVASGTGEFEGAAGLLFFNFVSDASGASFISSVTGELCLQDDDDDDK